jgi:hypothetical protein
MKRFIILAMAMMLMCSQAWALEEETVHVRHGQRLVVTTNAADYNVSSSVNFSATTGLYSGRVSVRDMEAKANVLGWTAGQVSSTPTLDGVTGGVAYWASTPGTINDAYIAAITEAWKVAKYIQGTNKLVTIDGIKTFDTSTGTNTIDLTTKTLPTVTWAP